MDKLDLLAAARRVISLEAEAVGGLAQSIGAEFVQAIELMRACRGRISVTGMGKAGLIARKIAATLASTRTLVLLEARGFGPEDYAMFHPGGSLGRRLLTKVSDIMHTGAGNPIVKEDAPLREAIMIMNESRQAATSVVDQSGRLTGFFTSGDL